MDDRIVRIEKKMDMIANKVGDISEILAKHGQEISVMAKTLDKLADVGLNQVRLEGLVMEARKDIDIAFSEIRKVKRDGVDMCNVNIERTKRLEEDVKSFKKIAWQVWLLIIAQLINFYLNFKG